MSLLLMGVSRPSFTGVIDLVGVSAEVAYSTRKLRSAYSGSAIRIRRETDNAETDIGFTSSGDFDAAALSSFAPLDGAFVTTWYDQSGNARNVVQTTAGNQPRISFDGEIELIGTKPALFYNGTSSRLATSGSVTVSGITVNAVAKANTVSGTDTLVYSQFSVSNSYYLAYVSNAYKWQRGLVAPAASGAPGTTNARVVTALASNGTNSQFFADGTSVWTGADMTSYSTTAFLGVGSTEPAGFNLFDGLIGEVVIFASNLTTTQRQTLERNQGTYFGITVA